MELAIKYHNFLIRKYPFTFHCLNCLVEEWCNVDGKDKLEASDGVMNRDIKLNNNFVSESSGVLEKVLASYYYKYDVYPLHI